MSWQDLKADLDDIDTTRERWFAAYPDSPLRRDDKPTEQVARRARDLFRSCDRCITGRVGIAASYTPGYPTQMEYGTCSRCGGTGIIPSETARGLATDEFFNAQVAWLLRVTLPAYLFGEETTT